MISHPLPPTVSARSRLRGAMAVVVWGAGAVLMAGGLAGCGAAGTGEGRGQSVASVDATQAHIAAVFRSKCGACHAPVQPGLVPHQTIEAAMQRHRRRARLTEVEWTEMVDFLAARDEAPADDSATSRKSSNGL